MGCLGHQCIIKSIIRVIESLVHESLAISVAAQPGSLKLMLASAAGRRRWLHRAVAIVKIYVVMLALAGVIRCDALLAQFHSGRRCSVSFLGGDGKRKSALQ